MNFKDEAVDNYLNSFDDHVYSRKEAIDEGLLTSFEVVPLSSVIMSQFRSRTILKYLIRHESIQELLSSCKSRYKLLDRDGEVQSSVSLQYFDNPELSFFNDHVNGKLRRLKVRIKKWKNTGNQYWEICLRKTNGRIIRKKFPVNGENPDDAFVTTLSKYTPVNPESLTKVLLAGFTRISLLDIDKTERITIDTNLVFATPDNPEDIIEMNGLAIVEVRKKRSSESFVAAFLESNHIHKTGISKYCLGIALTNPKAKINNYKPVLRKIEKTLSYGVLE